MKVKDLQWKRALRAALLVLLLNTVGITNCYALYGYGADVLIGDLYYVVGRNYSNPNDTIYFAYVTGHKDGTNATGHINIPSSVSYTAYDGMHTYEVTHIGWSAFDNCSGITGVTIPNTVTHIQGGFVNCTGLTGELVIPNSVIVLSGFTGCTGLTSVVIPNSVTQLGGFGGCTGLTGNLNIPNSVTEIFYGAFKDCSGLTGNLILPDTLTVIGDYAFENCSGLTGVLTIPNTVTSIGKYAFHNCSGFNEVQFYATNCSYYDYYDHGYPYNRYPPFTGCGGSLTIGNNVENIPQRLFEGGAFSGNLTIGNSVTWIGERAFYGCSGFMGNLTIPNSVTTIYGSAFYGCSGFNGTLTLPNNASFTKIYSSAFSGCSGFTGSLTIPNSVTTIEGSAFKNCSSFSGNLTIPNSITSIGGSAFYNCSGFDGTLTLPNNESFTKIESSTFYGCSGLTGNLTIPNSVTSIGSSAFYGCSGFSVVNYNIANHSDASSSPFYGCGGNLVIGSNVQRIPNYMFYYGAFTGNLTIPNSVTSIGSSAFCGCSGFTGDLNIPNSVTTIGSSAFYNCSGFNGTLTLPNNESFTKIESSTFYGCSGFTGNLNIPNSVTTIGSSAFRNCSGFSEVHYNVANHSDISSGYNSPFYGCGGILVIGNNVQRIPNYMFYYGNFTGELVIPNSVTSIGINSFRHCVEFTGNLTIPNSVDTISTGAFLDCTGFSDVLTIGTGIELLDESAFRRCSGITEIHYNAPNCQTAGSAQYPVFNEISNLIKIVIGENVETLPDYLFANCFSTLFIRSQAEVPPLISGANTFCGIDRGISVGVPCGSQEDYEEAEYWSEFTNYTGSEYQIAVKANPDYLGRAVIVQQPDCNTTICIVRALPNRGCRFLNWTCNGEVVTQIHSYAFTIDEDKVMVANFEPMKCFTGGGGTIVWSDPANWEPIGVPIDTMGVDIQSDVIIDTDVNIGSIYNYGNHVMTVMPNAVLTVDQTLGCPDPFGLVIEDGGQVVHHSEGVMATVRKTVDAYDATNDGWNLISFPLVDTGYVASVMNLLNNDYDLYYYDEPTHYWMNQEYTANNFNQLEAGKGYLYANSGVQNCVFDQAVYVTDRGLIDGHDASVLQGSQGTRGMNVNHGVGALLADDFTLKEATTLTGIEVYGSQTGSGIESTFTGMYVQIYDGNPMDGGQPIWGDANANIMSSTEWTGCYRVNSNMNTDFPIMRVKADDLNIELDAGTYYLVWSLTGNMSSGPWGIPVSVSYMENTGNGLQYWQGSWKYALDGGAEQGVGFAFRLYGTSDQTPTNNASFSFVGELRNSSANVSIPLNYTESAGNLKGLNLVGNPFVCDAYLLDENNEAMPFYRMSNTGDTIVAAPTGTAIKPCEGVFVICPNDRQAHSAVFTTTAPANVGETQNVPDMLLPTHDLLVNQNASLTNSVTQTVTLFHGWNWFSPNVEITLEDLQNALVDAVSNTNITIKSNTQNIAYNPGTNQWRGTLDSLDVSQMYMIQVGADCQITLTGTSINPNTCPITIHNGNNWIAFPLNENMSVSDAFDGFATNGDIIKGRTTTARYNNGNWRGGLDSLEPGQGYIYKSNVTETRTFTFPTSAK